jgi:hypothetical protein
MTLLGGTLTKLLTTVAAFMTVTAGVPRFECVCLDGTAKPFCPGRSAAGRCCAGPSIPDSTEVNHRCCQARDTSTACCAGASPASCGRPTGEGHAQAIKACGCQRTVVADSLAYTAEKLGNGNQVEAVSVVARAVTLVGSEQSVGSRPAERRFLQPPPDLVIVLCHFAC